MHAPRWFVSTRQRRVLLPGSGCSMLVEHLFALVNRRIQWIGQISHAPWRMLSLQKTALARLRAKVGARGPSARQRNPFLLFVCLCLLCVVHWCVVCIVCYIIVCVMCLSLCVSLCLSMCASLCVCSGSGILRTLYTSSCALKPALEIFRFALPHEFSFFFYWLIIIVSIIIKCLLYVVCIFLFVCWLACMYTLLCVSCLFVYVCICIPVCYCVHVCTFYIHIHTHALLVITCVCINHD